MSWGVRGPVRMLLPATLRPLSALAERGRVVGRVVGRGDTSGFWSSRRVGEMEVRR